MKLSQLEMVNRHKRDRQMLDDQLASLEIGLVMLRVGSAQMDEAMVALIRPVVDRELKARKAGIGRDLVSLGVDIDID